MTIDLYNQFAYFRFRNVCGWVSEMANNFASPSNYKFEKIILNNNNGRKLTVIAQNHNVDILNDINRVGQVTIYKLFLYFHI